MNAAAATLARTLPKRGSIKLRLCILYGFLLSLNLIAWLWAWEAFSGHPALLGVCLLIYGLGLRHAVDADHIAAIDNVTRKLMQDRQRPLTVGLWFALGHSAIVVLVTYAVASIADMLGRFEHLKAIGGTISTAVSAAFLLLIASMNVMIFLSIYRNYRTVRAGGAYQQDDLDLVMSRSGLLSRLLRPLLRLISRSYHMVLLGILFGLGFDTATEIAMFSVSSQQVAKGVALHTIMVFPLLFASGMALIDTTDGVLMLGAYEWAFVKPMRKLYYNMTITLVSIIIAVLIGGLEALGLIGSRFDLQGAVWRVVARLNDNFNSLGFAIIGVFIVAWGISYLVYRAKKLDDVALSTEA